MRDLLRQHIMLSDRQEQLKPLGLGKRNKTFSAVVDGVETCRVLYQARLTYNNYPRHRICLHLISALQAY
jgi:hypothetical protein